ncbi:MAG: DUF924 domain-containing protein [Bdellovibrionales bacterium]|nr:DUF924 domain-containing protein [Bdellovibrionales bacterium]
MDFHEVIRFWFEELSPKDWWRKSEELDQKISDRFLNIHTQAIKGELYLWRETPEGRLAEIIVLDQFSRNIYRGDPRSFLYDPIALVLAQECVQMGFDLQIDEDKRSFVYMPYMHSESKVIHEEALRIFSLPGSKGSLDFEIAHKKIIDRFGRYPHRNEILGRASTPEEIEFLQGPNSSF